MLCFVLFSVCTDRSGTNLSVLLLQDRAWSELPVSAYRTEQVTASNRGGKMHRCITFGVGSRVLVRMPYWMKDSEEKTERVPGWPQMQA